MVNYLARPVGMTVPQILYNKLLYQVSFRDFCWGEVLTVCSRKAVLFRFFYRKKKKALPHMVMGRIKWSFSYGG